LDVVDVVAVVRLSAAAQSTLLPLAVIALANIGCCHYHGVLMPILQLRDSTMPYTTSYSIACTELLTAASTYDTHNISSMP
jgi:hypothetical protein